MENTRPQPTSIPFRNPMKNSRMATTVSTDSTRFATKPSFALADCSPWS